MSRRRRRRVHQYAATRETHRRYPQVHWQAVARMAQRYLLEYSIATEGLCESLRGVSALAPAFAEMARDMETF